MQIDADRLWNSLASMARIGATPKGGVCRLALTDLDRQARDLFVSWCREAGCVVRVDRLGNLFARREGTEPSRAPVVTGSHLDTQPTGGRFDGVYGVLAGLEVLRTLNDSGHATRAPIEVAVWTNEEGSRFAPAMVASGAFAGVFDEEYALSRRDLEGRSIGEELARIGYAGSEPLGGRPLAAFFELHIEQGPILEAQRKTIGVVTGAQGQRWYEIVLRGQEAHAGPTPMSRRRDALVGASQIVLDVNRIGQAHAPHACATVGLMQVDPNSRNTIPGRVFFTVDFRHPHEATLAAMDRELRHCVGKASQERGLEVDLRQIWHSPAVCFDPDCVASVRRAAQRLGLTHLDIISGAGHDACYLNRVAPTGMIFVPCENGISHNEVENAKPADLAAGAQVLLEVLAGRADRESC
ncbi:MAG TPA: Zn-dependent hydrolase [Steroidobacteraceae bacterium]|nr:Zn-dependent hydrolase [Steroidobacteraceae bacterium]